MPADWLPDWRVDTNYPDALTATPTQWAWEFLRRNPKYQARWAELIAPYLDSEGIFDDDTAMQSEHAKKGIGIIISPHTQIEDEFGLWNCAPDPATNAPSRLIFKSNALRSRPWNTSSPCEERVRLTIRPYEHIVWFDLSAPLAHQLEQATAQLERAAKKLKNAGIAAKDLKPRYDQLRKFLRILDAKALGVSESIIAKEIYSGKVDIQNAIGNVQNDAKAARKYRDRDYQYLK